MKCIELNDKLIVIGATRKAIYQLVKSSERVNEQQFNLPEGQNISYPDGSKFMHIGDYALLRNWVVEEKVIDRVAIPWSMLYVVS